MKNAGRLLAALLVAASVIGGLRPVSAAIVASRWPVGGEPFVVAVDTSTGEVYVANNGSYFLNAVDPVTGAMRRFDTTGPSNAVAVDASARRAYSSNADRSIDVFDADTGARLATLAAGGFGLAVDPSAHRLYAAGNFTLALIDTDTNTIVRTVAAPPNGSFWSVAVDHPRGRVYASDIYRDELLQLDATDLSLLGVLPLGTEPRVALAVDEARGLVYVAGSDELGPPWPGSTFNVIDAATFTRIHTTVTPGFPAGIALSPATHRIYLTDMSDRRVYALDDETFAIVETIDGLPFAPGVPALHPDGRLYAPDHDARIYGFVYALDLSDHAPAITQASISPTSPLTNDVLSVSAQAYDPDLRAAGAPDPTTISYQWSRNGVAISGATGATLDLSIAGNGDRDDVVAVTVTASDGRVSSTVTVSVVVANTVPTVAVSVSDATPWTNDTLVATATPADADADQELITYEWRANGVLVRSTVTTATTDSLDLAQRGNGDNGDVVTVMVTANDGAATSAPASVSAVVTPGRHR